MGSGPSKPAAPIGLSSVNLATENEEQPSVQQQQPSLEPSLQPSVQPSLQQQQPSLKPSLQQQPSWKQTVFGRSTVLKKVDLRTGFTEDYGDSVNMISFLSAVYSRLSYMNDHQFLGHYSKIFGPIIPTELLQALNNQSVKELGAIINDKEMFNLVAGKEKFGLKTFASKAQFGGVGLQFLPWAQKINIVNGEQRIDATNPNCDFEVKETTPDPNLVFVSITTSNYNETYIVGDKRMPNIVTVVFRGTSDAKSAGSYTKASSTVAMWTGSIRGFEEGFKDENKEKFLFGIYKILMDTVHVLMHSIQYVADKIKDNDNNNKVSIITTGHSLGGALATIFAYVYITHISNLPDFQSTYPRFNTSIACFSLGAPRVFSAQLADRFCLLTTNNETLFDLLDDESRQFIEKAKSIIPGRITYLRIVTKNDPVPNLPPTKLGFAHPCSSNKIEEARKNTNVDCLTQVENSFSNRCRGTRLAMTYNFQDLPLNCVDTKEAREKNKGPFLAKNVMAYHTEYLGISFIGGLPLSKVVGNMIKRVSETSKKGDTVCRLIFYPSISGDNNLATIGFYNLVEKRSKSKSSALNVSDVDFEKAESTEKDTAPEIVDETGSTKVPQVLPNTDYSYSTKVLSLFKNMVGQDTIVHVPEDIYDTSNVFEELIKGTKTFDIIKELTPSIQYETLITTGTPQQDQRSAEQSFEGNKEMINVVWGGGNERKTRKGKKRRNLHLHTFKKPTGRRTTYGVKSKRNKRSTKSLRKAA